MKQETTLSKRKAKRLVKQDSEIGVVSSPEIKTLKKRGIKFYLFILTMLILNGFTYSYWLTDFFDDSIHDPITQTDNLPQPNKNARDVELPPDWDSPPQNIPVDMGYNASSGQLSPGALPPGVRLPGISGMNSAITQGYGVNDGIRQNFTGQIKDAESNLLYYGARYYNPQHGRFTSVDPENASADLEDPQSWNGYAYARNNPLLYTDPDGLKYKVCNREGQCWTHDDDQFFKAKDADDFSFVGSRNSRTGLDSGVIYDNEGNQVGAYQQTSHDSQIQQMLWGSAHTLDTWEPVIEFVQPVPLPGGSALPKLFKIGNGVRKALPILQKICFVAGTPILTENGLKPIEQVKEGDKVLSYDEKTKQTEYKTVLQTTIRFAEAGRILLVKVEGEIESLGVTGEHPFYVRIHRARDNISNENDEGEWREANDLRIGDEIRTASGTWAKVESIFQRIESANVYNFEVADNHNYFVGRTNLLVHNNDCIKLTAAMLSQSRVIAKGDKIRDVARLVREHGGRAKDWVKKSSPEVMIDGRRAEIHWYQNSVVGRVEEKVVFLD